VIYASLESPLGSMTASAKGDALTGLWFVGGKYYPSDTGTWAHEPDRPIFMRLREWLEDYFAGGRNVPLPPLELVGTPFQRTVWDMLLEIPYGQVITYGEIAKRIAAARGLRSMSAQAVGGAVGHNPISILVPCHRVIGRDGSLTGYAGGLDRKKALLRIEGADTSTLLPLSAGIT
jgi:methylated-DNA-[protein]-cysteine S-methyltransferase